MGKVIITEYNKSYLSLLETINIIDNFKIYFMTILSELLVLLGCLIMGQTESLDFWSILVINGILFIPLSLVILLKSGRYISNNEVITRASLLSVITMISIYKVDGKEAPLIPLTILSMGILLFTLFNSNVSIRRLSNELAMGVVSLLIIIIAVVSIIIINSIVIRDIIVIELVVSIIFFIIFEILARKWQNSLMR